MAGFLNLSRDIIEWGWYKDANTRSVFIHLLLKANWKDGEFMGYKIGRGQLVTGRKELAENLGLSERNIRTAINHLKSTNEVTIKTTNKFSIVTICKYDKWAINDDNSDQQNDQQGDQQVTNNRPASDQQVTTIEKEKKEKKEINKENNNIPPIIPPSGEIEGSLLEKIALLESRLKELENENVDLKKKIDEKEKTDLDLSIVSEEMRPIVEDWLAYKKQKRQSYKPRGFVSFYNKLLKDCGGDPCIAQAMVENSKANNYDGLFPLKQKQSSRELPGQVIRDEKREYNENTFFEL